MSGCEVFKIDITGYKRLRLSEMDDAGAYNLVRAIVDQACHDYIHGRRMEQKHPEKKSDMRRDAQRFIRSAWFNTLTGLDGTYFLRKLEEMV